MNFRINDVSNSVHDVGGKVILSPLKSCVYKSFSASFIAPNTLNKFSFSFSHSPNRKFSLLIFSSLSTKKKKKKKKSQSKRKEKKNGLLGQMYKCSLNADHCSKPPLILLPNLFFLRRHHQFWFPTHFSAVVSPAAYGDPQPLRRLQDPPPPLRREVRFGSIFPSVRASQVHHCS